MNRIGARTRTVKQHYTYSKGRNTSAILSSPKSVILIAAKNLA